MEFFATFVSGVTTFGVALCAVLAVVLWRQRSDHHQANLILSALLVVYVLDGLYFGLYISLENIAYNIAYIYGSGHMNALLIAPLTYLYVKKLYHEVFPTPVHYFRHLAPLGVVLFLYIAMLNLSDGAASDLVDRNFQKPNAANTEILKYFDYWLFICAWGLWLQLIAYGVMITKLQLLYRKKIETLFSDIHQIKQQWVFGFMVIWWVSTVLYTGLMWAYTFWEDSVFPLYINIQLLVQCALFLFLGIQGLRHPFLFSPDQVETLQTARGATPYQNSALSDEQANELKTKLLAHMQDNKPYLEPNITATSLAKQLNIHDTNLLSEVLSQQMGENFYRLINRYRVEDAKLLLKEGYTKNRSILDLAHKVGFNSSSVFYARFKEFTGSTPKQYLNQSNSDSAESEG